MVRLLLITFSLLIPVFSWATHLAGGSIEVTCNGGNSFTVTVVKYKDPLGNPMTPPFTLVVEEMSTGNTTNYPLTFVDSTSQVYPPVSDPCLVPPANAILQEYVYEATITLTNGTGYYLYELDNARNTTQNVQAVGGQGPAQTLYAQVPDPATYPCNNSPSWNVGPPISVCINQPMNYDGGATDPDGDNLQYRLCDALTHNALAPGTWPFPAVNYVNPYSGTYPVSSAPALSINTNTGIVTGTPNLAGRWLFNICVDEYRNGVKIGEYMREVQMTVSTTCTNPPNTTIVPDYNSNALGVAVKASCDDSTMSFTSSIQNAFSYSWDFGVPGINSDTSDLANPTFTYPDTGTFTVTLITNKGTICADTATIPALVYPDVIPGFTFSEPACVGAPIQFTDTSTMTYGVGHSWQWTFGAVGVNNATIPNPVRSYSLPGTYNVSMVIETTKGCRDTSIQPVSVALAPSANLPSAPIILCEGYDTILQPVSNGTTFQWTPSTGLSCDTCKNPVATPTTTTVYSFTAFGPTGCSNSDFIVVQVRQSPEVDAGPDQFLCGTGSVNLNATLISSPGGVVWNWTPTTGLSNPNIPNPTASPTQSTTYIVSATALSGGCVGRDTVTVFLNSVSVNAGNNITICPGDSTQLNSTTPVGNATYAWAPATNISDPNVADPQVWPSTTTTYTLTITDPVSGCSGVDSVTVSVNTPPNVNAGIDTTICEQTSAQLQATGAQSYQWTADPSLSQTNISNPVATPSATTTYTVTGVDAIGCTATDQVTVTVVPPASITTSGDETICIGESTTLNAGGAVQYSWTPAGSLAGANTANPVATPTNTTTYFLTATDANGCVIDTTLTIIVAPLPTINAGADVSICFGDTTTLSASGGISYSWAPAGSLINANSANPQAHPTTTTMYTVTGTDANGCTNTDSVQVTVNTLANGSFSPDTAICIGESVTLSASGFSQYQWKPGFSLSCTNCASTVASPTATTNYTVVVTDANGCVDSGDVTVTVNQLPTVVTGPDQTICIGDSVQISANINNPQGYSWSPSASLNDPSVRAPKASPATTTTYTVTATDQNGCSNTGTVTVNVNPLPTVSTSFSTTTICEGDTVQLSASGGVSYNWSPSNTLSCNTCPDPVASPLLNTTYTVEVTDANGCTNQDSVEVNVNVLQPGNFIADTAICIGESVTLFANGFTSYNWYPNTNLSCTNCAMPVATPAATTTYFAAVEDANGCQDTGQVTVTVNPLPTASISVADDSICIGSSTTLTASGGIQYTWSPATGLNDPAVANPLASPSSTTNYTVTVTDANGCVNTANQQVTVLPLPTVTLTSASSFVCKYDSTQLNVSGGVSYQWSPGNSLTCTTCPNPEAHPLVTTQYSVQVTDQFGCVNEDSITINVNSAAGNISADTAICVGDATTLQISGGISYQWSPATGLSCTTCPNPVATPVNTTTYSVEVIDANGCKDTADVTVTVNSLPTVSAGADVVICENDQTQLSASSPTAVSYSWSPSAGLDNPNISSPIASPTATTTYTVTVQDGNTCSNSDDVMVTVNLRPATNAGSDVGICVGDTAQLQATGAASYSWSPTIGLSNAAIANPQAFPNTTTTYTVTGTAANGCTAEDQVVVTVNPLPVVSVTPSSTICIGDDIQLTASGGASYQWAPAGVLSCTNCANPIATPTSTTTFTVTAFTNAGCSDVDSTTVTVASPANLTISADTTVCPGEEVQLSASGGVTYNWSPQTNNMMGANTATPTIQVTQNETYTVAVVDANGCDITETVQVGVFVPANPLATGADTICFGEGPVALSASNGVSYNWQPANSLDDPTSSTPLANPGVTTIYTVAIIDSNGCPNSDQVTVTVIPLPNVDAGPDISLYASSRAVLEATGALSYVWSPNTWIQDTSQARTFIFPEDTITYFVTGTDAFGCQNTDTITVFVLPTPQYYVPNAFSPDGDGKNDVFRISFYENFRLEQLIIFNRWGEAIFQTNDITVGWDGRTSNGEPAPIGTYVYRIKGTDELGAPLRRQGNITLLR